MMTQEVAKLPYQFPVPEAVLVFKLGERVRLKNHDNAPVMIVTVHGDDLYPDRVKCSWFTTTGEYQLQAFTYDQLQKVPRNKPHGNTVLSDATLVKIRAEFKAGGITQKKLAEKYGVNPSTINYILKDTKRRK